MKVDIRRVLEKARSGNVKLIIATSAGEEGLDLPEADLLIIWSNVASPLRFIQRHGRIIRLTGIQSLKFVAYIVTPNTPDMDTLLDSIEIARKTGIDIPVDKEVVEALWRKTTRSHVLTLLEGRALPAERISEIADMPIDLVHKALHKLGEKGDAGYIYTYLSKTYFTTYDLSILGDEFNEYIRPDHSLEAKIKTFVDNRELRAVTGNYNKALHRLKNILSKYGSIKGITAILQVPLPTGALQQVILHYTFTINNENVLEIVVRNIYSIRKYLKYIKDPYYFLRLLTTHFWS